MLSIDEDRRRACIQVHDWESAGRPNAWTKRVADRVREEVAEQLPKRSAEVETIDLGFWRP